MKTVLGIAFLLFLFVASAAVDAEPKQQPLKAYTDSEAYSVYSSVLPVSSLYGRSTTGMYIQSETLLQVACIPGKNDSDARIREAAADYESKNQQQWHLLPRFQVSGPVELIPEAKLRDTYKQIAYLQLSAVGFSKDRSVALVYAGHHCGGLCGLWDFYLVKRESGQWKPAQFGSCGGMS